MVTVGGIAGTAGARDLTSGLKNTQELQFSRLWIARMVSTLSSQSHKTISEFNVH